MENGYGKRTKLSQYRIQARGGTGTKTAKITQKTGQIVFSKVLENFATASRASRFCVRQHKEKRARKKTRFAISSLRNRNDEIAIS